MMTVIPNNNVTYLYTGDTLNEGLYCVKIQGVLKKYGVIQTIIANAVPYTGHSRDLKKTNFSKFEHGIAITISEENPKLTTPNSSFFKIVHEQKWNPCRTSPPDYY